MEEKLKEEITELLRELQAQDSIELGSTKGKVKVYVNFADEKASRVKIETALELLKEKKAEALE